MPYSDGQGKETALGWYQQIAPKTVVDIGAGCGTYAKIMRTEPRTDHWTGIEAWQPYLGQFDLPALYDEILVADARHLSWPTYQADLVIAGDVLEHMTSVDAAQLISRIQFAAKNLIVSIPVLHLPQDAVNGNPHERHIDHWHAAQMARQLGPGVVDSWVGDVLAYFWWNRDTATPG